MEVYGLKQRKKRKIWLIPVIVIAIMAVFVYGVGIIVNITNADHDKIVRSVSENETLKSQINDLNAKVAELEAQIEGLNGELSARPTEAPAGTAAPENSETDSYDYEVASPRNNNY